MFPVMEEGATDKGGGYVADGTDHGSPKLAPRKPRTTRRLVVDRGTRAARVGEYLADGDENGKCNCEMHAQNHVQSSAETEPADGGKQRFSWPGVMVQPASGSMELDRQGNPGRYAGGKAKKETEAEAIPDAEYDRVRYRTGKHSQWTVLSAQQVVGKIQTAQHIKRAADNADGGDCVVVHSEDCRANTLSARRMLTCH